MWKDVGVWSRYAPKRPYPHSHNYVVPLLGFAPRPFHVVSSAAVVAGTLFVFRSDTDTTSFYVLAGEAPTQITNPCSLKKFSGNCSVAMKVQRTLLII